MLEAENRTPWAPAQVRGSPQSAEAKAAACSARRRFHRSPLHWQPKSAGPNRGHNRQGELILHLLPALLYLGLEEVHTLLRGVENVIFVPCHRK